MSPCELVGSLQGLWLKRGVRRSFVAAFCYLCRDFMFQTMQNIINSLKTQFNLSDGSIRELFAHSAVREIPKKQVLTSSFRHDPHFYFIEQGITRSYCVVDGKEVTSWFSAEGEIVFSTNNFYGKTPGYEYEIVQALEDTVAYAIPIKDLDVLYQTNIEIANWSRILHQQAFIETEKRLIARLYQSAEERYVDLLQSRPMLFRRVNLGHIASFLGISQVTLCQLRNKLR